MFVFLLNISVCYTVCEEAWKQEDSLGGRSRERRMMALCLKNTELDDNSEVEL
jgi:hypothetical protein